MFQLKPYWLRIFVLWHMVIASCSLLAQDCRDDVPASTPTNRFINHDNGTVSDKQTGLMWKQCIERLSGSDCTASDGYPLEMEWIKAMQHANTTVYAGYDDWRIPNIKELQSIVEYKCKRLALNLAVFPDDRTHRILWSSTPITNSDAFVVDSAGMVFNKSKGFPVYMRLVRGGQ